MKLDQEQGWALVTGASSGIGQTISSHLAGEGYHVVVNYFRDPEGAERTLGLVRQQGRRGIAIDADVGRDVRAGATSRGWLVGSRQ